MSGTPEWLPALAPVTGDLSGVIGRLYAVFHQDVKLGRLKLQLADVWWDRRPREVFGFTFEEGFWHLVSRDYEVWTRDGREWKRDFDPPRAERLPWFAPTIRHAETDPVLLWEYAEASGKANTYVWLRDSDYVIVLTKRPIKSGFVFFLVTAYHVDGTSDAAKLQQKYEKRCR